MAKKRKTYEEKIRDLLIRCKNRNVDIINKRNGKRLAESTLRHRCTNANAEKYKGIKFFGDEPDSPSPFKKRKSPSPSPKKKTPSPKRKSPSPSPKRKSPSPSPKRSYSPVDYDYNSSFEEDYNDRVLKKAIVTSPLKLVNNDEYGYDTDFINDPYTIKEVDPDNLPDEIIVRKAGKSPERLNVPGHIKAGAKDHLSTGHRKILKIAKDHPSDSFGRFK